VSLTQQLLPVPLVLPNRKAPLIVFRRWMGSNFCLRLYLLLQTMLVADSRQRTGWHGGLTTCRRRPRNFIWSHCWEGPHCYTHGLWNTVKQLLQVNSHSIQRIAFVCSILISADWPRDRSFQIGSLIGRRDLLLLDMKCDWAQLGDML
jgi:hypothetical protein